MSKTIINGIDVSECCYFNSVTYEEPYCNIDQERLYTCSSDKNCYYKQLKRLQEENEKLKVRFNELYNNSKQLANKYNKYGGNKENELVEIINKTTDERNKFRQALKEIREMVSGNYEILDPQAKQDIKKLIDEVLNDRN